MLKYYFVIATVIVGWTTAEDVPLHEFNNLEYQLTDADSQNYDKVLDQMRRFGVSEAHLSGSKIKEGTIFVLHTPDHVGGKYVTEWRDGGHKISGADTLDTPTRIMVGRVNTNKNYRSEGGNKLILTEDNDEENFHFKNTMEFSEDEVKESFELNGAKSTSIYKRINKAAEN